MSKETIISDKNDERRGIKSALNCFVMFLRIIFTPSCWIRNRRTNRKWDRKILELLEDGDITCIGDYTARLGDKLVWIENYPYEFGYEAYTINTGMPSRSTVFKLKDAISRAET